VTAVNIKITFLWDVALNQNVRRYVIRDLKHVHNLYSSQNIIKLTHERPQYTVTYRSIARQRPDKYVPTERDSW
jgi:hypothetical protein